MILVVSVALLALILNAEGMFLANEPRLLMVLVVLFIAGGTTLNFVQIQRWRRQQVNSQASLEAANNMIAEDRQRLTRYYRRWLVAMPIFYVLGLFGGKPMPLRMQLFFTAFAICAYGYVLFLYRRTKRT
jgi:hypothetical protein